MFRSPKTYLVHKSKKGSYAPAKGRHPYQVTSWRIISSSSTSSSSSSSSPSSPYASRPVILPSSSLGNP